MITEGKISLWAQQKKVPHRKLFDEVRAFNKKKINKCKSFATKNKVEKKNLQSRSESVLKIVKLNILPAHKTQGKVILNSEYCID